MTKNKQEKEEQNSNEEKQDQKYIEELKEEINRLEDKVNQLEEEKEEYLNGWKRTKADFANYKKDEKGRKAKIEKRAKKEIIMEILEIIDDFELAEENIPEEEKTAYITGLLKIKSQLQELLRSEDVEEIDVEEQEFDPNIHEAIEVVDDEGESGTIIEEVRKGYLMNGELLRPAKVKIIK